MPEETRCRQERTATPSVLRMRTSLGALFLLIGALFWSGPSVSCPLVDARYVFEQMPGVTMTFERVGKGEPHGWSILGVYAVVHRGSQQKYFTFGAATNGDLLITLGFKAAMVADFRGLDGRSYGDDPLQRAAPRLVTREPAGAAMHLPQGRWRLRCK